MTGEMERGLLRVRYLWASGLDKSNV
jgi:hypothetical protein